VLLAEKNWDCKGGDDGISTSMICVSGMRIELCN
jgi:hypothetical protein